VILDYLAEYPVYPTPDVYFELAAFIDRHGVVVNVSMYIT
jgi:hypothetical protein